MLLRNEDAPKWGRARWRLGPSAASAALPAAAIAELAGGILIETSATALEAPRLGGIFERGDCFGELVDGAIKATAHIVRARGRRWQPSCNRIQRKDHPATGTITGTATNSGQAADAFHKTA